MKHIQFMKVRGRFGVVSILLVAASITLIMTKGVRKSVDFEGGTKITVKFQNEDLGDGTLNDALAKAGQKAEIAHLVVPSGSEFSVKVRNPEVEEGKEADASLERLHRIERAFGSINNEEADLLALIGQASEQDIKSLLIAENPFALNAADTVIEQAYAEAAKNIKASFDGAEDVGALAKAVDPERAGQLESGIRLSFPALNRTTPDLLSALLRRDDPLSRGLGADYSDVARQVMDHRGTSDDFITDMDAMIASITLPEGENSDALKGYVTARFYLGAYNIVSNETFSPSIAAELLGKAWEAILLALAGILFYISIRFTLGYAVAAVIALSHDVIIALGAFSLVGAELSNPVIAAFLTIIGYSLNDTIVVFDRIRENLRGTKKPAVMDLMNRSINEMLSRTLVTSLTTFFVVLVIYVGANATLRDFAFPLLVGIVVGTYSSVFVASPTLLLWHDKYKSIVT